MMTKDLYVLRWHDGDYLRAYRMGVALWTKRRDRALTLSKRSMQELAAMWACSERDFIRIEAAS